MFTLADVNDMLLKMVIGHVELEDLPKLLCSCRRLRDIDAHEFLPMIFERRVPAAARQRVVAAVFCGGETSLVRLPPRLLRAALGIRGVSVEPNGRSYEQSPVDAVGDGIVCAQLAPCSAALRRLAMQTLSAR